MGGCCAAVTAAVLLCLLCCLRCLVVIWLGAGCVAGWRRLVVAHVIQRARCPAHTPPSLLHPGVTTCRSTVTALTMHLLDWMACVCSACVYRRLVLCSGKVWYDLHAEREKRGLDKEGSVALVRVEQVSG